jgi:peptide/nickel transport system permease protein
MTVESPDPALKTVPATVLTTVVSAQTSRRARMRELGRALLRSKTFMIGLAILLFWIFDAIFWPLFVPYDPINHQDLINTLKGPSSAHWFGTDDFGRDMFSRVLAGASTVLVVAPAATALGLVGGISLGLVTGYYRGLVDDLLMRVVDALLSFPGIVIALLVLTVLGPSELNVILIIGIVFTPLIARTVRSAVLVEREREYVAAAKLLGEPGISIMVKEILPNVVGPITVEATIRLGYAIFFAASLAFLGLGLQQPSPDWGLTIALGRPLLQVAPWIVLFPALALATLVVGLNFVADGLKQAIEE